jgi:hypothetical protein
MTSATTTIETMIDAQTSTNLIDLPWIPVHRADRTSTTVGLKEMFLTAHDLAEISATSPLEHEAITRFLTTVTALVVRAAGEDWDPREDARFPEHAVDAALLSVSGSLDLASIADPFMQDPSIRDAAELNTAAVTSLSLDRPNQTVQAWHFRGQLNERADGQVGWVRLASLLITFWYFSGTNNLDIDGRKQAGSLCGKAGNGLHVFERGPSLAHTLMANTPRVWVEGSDVPAWADRDGTLSGATFQGGLSDLTPLWWGSYSPNTTIVWADPGTGLPALCVTGGSPRQPRGVPAPLTRAAKDDQAKVLFAQRFPQGTDLDGVVMDPKVETARISKELAEVDDSNKKAITSLADKLRQSDSAGTMAAAKPVRMSPDLAPLRNLAAWYEAGAADLLAQRVNEVVLAPSRRDPAWALEFCHTQTKNPTALVYTSGAWVGRTPAESATFTLGQTEAADVLSVAARVEQIADIVCRPLRKGSILWELVHTRKDLRDQFYVRADAACTQAITYAAAGKGLSVSVLSAVRDAALVAFDEVVTPFAGPTLGPSIIQARGRVQMDLSAAIK